MLGFDAENDSFAENSWYFRNALVRANYTNIQKGIYETTDFLEKFLRNLLLNEKHALHNREMHISGKFLSVQADPINDPIKLEGREKQILDIVYENPSLTRVEMAKRIGCSESTVKRTLQKLIIRGVIKRIGSNKKGEWSIVYKK